MDNLLQRATILRTHRDFARNAVARGWIKESERHLLIDGIIDYILDEIKPDFASVELKDIWEMWLPSINKSREVLIKQQIIQERNVENGRKGGAPKGNQNAVKNDRQQQPQLENNPETTQNQPKNNTKKNKKKKEKMNNEEENEYLNKNVDKAFIPIIHKWLSYKRERDESYHSEIQLRTMCDRLIKDSNNNPDIASDIVDKSIMNGWKGLFPPKEEQVPQQSIGMRLELTPGRYDNEKEKWNNIK